MVKNIIAWASLFVVMALFAGCQPKESPVYKRLTLTDFTLGVSFGMSPAQVHEILGTPSYVEERQGGASVEEYFLPEEVTEPGDDVPSASFTFNNGALIRVSNTYFPENPDSGTPPFFAEPLPGVKLGARRSGFVDELGVVEKSGAGETWRFDGAEGEIMTVKAWFTDLESIGDALCSKFTVTYINQIEVPRGEAFKKKK